jgi:hypothetical protein
MFTSLTYYHWLRRRRRRRIVTLALIITLTWALLAALHTPARHGHAKPATRTPRQTARSRPASARATVATAGQGLRWADFHGIALPSSATDGPRHTRDGLAWGFADTPRGALLAAVNIGVRTAALWGPAIYQPTITRQVTGADAAALLAADTRDYAGLRAAAHVRAGQPAGRGYAAETAYRFAAWAPGDATVDIVTAGPGNGGTTVIAVTRIEVLWQHGDWRVVAPPGGNWANSASSISSLAGYTPFPDAR